MQLVNTVEWILIAYVGIGFLFALFFVTAGVSRVDPAAKGGSWGFRVLIFPASGALWPLLALRLMRGCVAPPDERNAHRDAAKSDMRSNA